MSTHIDDWIDSIDRPSSPGERYARWVLFHARLPATLKMLFEPIMREHKLFCTYQGKRYRCIGASRLGDVWLTDKFDREFGYDLRIDVDGCSDWSATPDCPSRQSSSQTSHAGGPESPTGESQTGGIDGGNMG